MQHVTWAVCKSASFCTAIVVHSVRWASFDAAHLQVWLDVDMFSSCLPWRTCFRPSGSAYDAPQLASFTAGLSQAAIGALLCAQSARLQFVGKRSFTFEGTQVVLLLTLLQGVASVPPAAE